MPKIVFPANTTIFAGGYPEHVEDAKKWLEKNGYTKSDVRIYKKEHSTPYQGEDPAHKGKVFKNTSLYVDTIRPIAIDCGVVECRNHQPEQKE